MTDSMVERVARELEIAFVEKTMHHPVAKFSPLSRLLSWLCPILARAAIEAMRKPTEAMVEAYDQADLSFQQTGWHLAIDAALKD